MSSRPAGGGEQKLKSANARWMRANRQTLDDSLPAPGRCWKWSDTTLSRSMLCHLRNRCLIKPCDELDGWQTTKRCWQALRRYGNSDEDARGEIVGQETIEQYVEEIQEKNQESR